MHRPTKPDGLDLVISATRGSRSMSGSSDRPSLSGRSIMSPPAVIDPAPLYIAASAASHLVSSELDTDGVTLSSGALTLINGFLDQILFSILSNSHSTQLHALRPAVIEVLKAKLGKEAVLGADEELKEYLGDGDDEELAAFHGGQEPKGDFDLELAWKLARLRCMVYTRLGDLEEDDEDEYIEREHLDDQGQATRRYSNPSSVTPAAAIFLTSVLEYLGEQALFYAGQASQRRFASMQQEQSNFTALPGVPERLVVEETDMFSVGRDSPLSRLWRTWRRNVKSPRNSIARAISRESLRKRSALHSRNGSMNVVQGDAEQSHPQSLDRMLDEAEPSKIALPMSENDVNEIEVPGLAREFDDESDLKPPVTPEENSKPRPSSMFVMPNTLTPQTPTSPTASSMQKRPRFGHTRSRSLPSPAQSSLRSSFHEEQIEPDFVTPLEMAYPLEDSEAQHEPFFQQEETDSEDLEEETPTQESLPLMQQDEHINERPESAQSTTSAKIPPSRQYQKHDATPAAVAAAVAAAGASSLHTSKKTISKDASADLTSGSEQAASKSSNSQVMQQTDSSPQEAMSRHAARAASGTSSPINRKPTSGSQSEPTGETGIHDPEDLALSPEERTSVQFPKTKSVDFAPATSPRDKPIKPSEPTSKRNQQGPVVPAKATLVHLPPSSKYSSVDAASRLAPLKEVSEPTKISSNEKKTTMPSSQIQNRMPAQPTDRKSSTHTRNAGSTSSKSSQSTATPQTIPKAAYNADVPAHSVDRKATSGVPPSASAPAMSGTRSNSTADRRPVTQPAQSPSKKQPIAVHPTFDAVQQLPGSKSLRGNSEGRQSLDNLIMSDETLHYTLTPQNMREMEDSPPSKKKTGTAELAEFLRTTGPPGDEMSRQVKGPNPLRSNPPNAAASTSSGSNRSRSGSKKSVEIQIPAHVTASPSKTRNRNVQPRDPVVEKGTTRDLADFAKSTGPDSPQQLPNSLKQRTAQAQIDVAPPNVNSGRSVGELPLRTQPPVPRQSSSAKRTASRLQARDATFNRGEQSSDLIDFIREGPPRDPRDGSHRIPRTVAPFRTTMDSDELAALGSPRDRDRDRDRDLNGRSSMASTQASSTMGKSMQSSVNSRTGLLDSTNRTNGREVSHQNSSSSEPLSNLADDDDDASMIPKRKQRRVKDPYAIDSDSDEDLDEVASTPRPKPRKEEESLIDFLRNTSPPPESRHSPQPLAIGPEQQAQAVRGLKRLSSNPLMNKALGRSASINGLNKRAEIPPSSYKPVAESGARAPRAGRQGAKSGVGGTADLADFLRNSRPPETTRTYAPSPTREENGGLTRLFTRRRKAAI